MQSAGTGSDGSEGGDGEGDGGDELGDGGWSPGGRGGGGRFGLGSRRRSRRVRTMASWSQMIQTTRARVLMMSWGSMPLRRGELDLVEGGEAGGEGPSDVRRPHRTGQPRP